MPKSAQYSVSWLSEQATYHFNKPEDGASLSGEAWLKWLEQHHGFAFHGRNGHINVLKEKRSRGGVGYWYAYQRYEGKMIKRYIGASAQVSMERLEEIIILMAQEKQMKRAPIVPSDQKPMAMQFEPLLMTKLQLPRLQRALIPRERLLALLDQGLAYKLTLIAGPAGYGKTTLIGQWVAERRGQADFPHVACVTLDEGDNDPLRFWRYMIAACQQLHIVSGEEALELLRAHRLPPFKPLEMMLTVLLNALSQLEHPGVLILDDVHMITSPQVIESLSFFLEHLPGSMHLVLLIRGDPPFSIVRLRARNELLDIYPPHLFFSMEETRAFFLQELSFPLSPTLLRRIDERLEGWPAGLRMLALASRRSSNEQDVEYELAAFMGNHWSIQEYFLTEVLHTLPDEQQAFLLQTSILPRFTAELCDAITGREDSARLIEALRGSDLFVVPLDNVGQWSRYLALFAEAMQQEAHIQLGEEQLRQLAARASRWYEQHMLFAEAITTALDAADFPRAARLIEQYIESKQQRNFATVPELYSLKRWSERLPEQELERHPDLCIHYALTLLFVLMEAPYFPGGKQRIEHLLQVAEQRWRDANTITKLAEVFAFRALLVRREGNLLQAVTWARQSLAWLPQEDRTWRNLALTVVGVGELLEGNLRTARAYLLEALTISEQQGNRVYARATRGMLSGASFEQGELRHTAEQFRQMQAEARVHEDRDDIAHTQLGLARVNYQWNKLEEAEQAAQETLQLGVQMKVEEFQAQATAQLALIEHARGFTSQALQRLTAWLLRGQTITSSHSYQISREVQAVLARIQLTSGDLASVERWFASIEQREEVLPLLQRQREQVVWARLLVEQGMEIAAIELLENLDATARQTGHGYLKLEIQVVLVVAYARQGVPEKARAQLDELLTIARSEGYLRLFLDEGEAMAELLRWFLPRLRGQALLNELQRILVAFGSSSDGPQPTAGTSWLLEPLSQQERKVLRLLVAGNANAEIASALVVSVNTVRTQVQSIYRKLNVNNRVEASSVARQLALL